MASVYRPTWSKPSLGWADGHASEMSPKAWLEVSWKLMWAQDLVRCQPQPHICSPRAPVAVYTLMLTSKRWGWNKKSFLHRVTESQQLSDLRRVASYSCLGYEESRYLLTPSAEVFVSSDIWSPTRSPHIFCAVTQLAWSRFAKFEDSDGYRTDILSRNMYFFSLEVPCGEKPTLKGRDTLNAEKLETRTPELPLCPLQLLWPPSKINF